MDTILDLRNAGESNDAVDELWRRLEEQGFVTRGSPLPRLRAGERFAPRLVEFAAATNDQEELEVLSATLGRLEYQMAKLDFGVSVHVTVKKRNKIQVNRRRTIYLGKSVKLLGQSVRAVGRAFLPTMIIQSFVDTAKKTGGQDAGVGIAFSLTKGAWVAFIKPLRGRPLPPGFAAEFASRDRDPLKGDGLDGWVLKGRQKQPESTARFLVRAWGDYIERTNPS